jgi:hypothetical protein
MTISPLAGHPPPPAMLRDVAQLVTAYYTGIPDPAVPAQRVGFTSGHRGSAFETRCLLGLRRARAYAEGAHKKHPRYELAVAAAPRLTTAGP